MSGHYDVRMAITGAVCDVLGELADRGYLTRAGLRFVHGKLDPEVPSELIAGARPTVTLRLRVSELLAAEYEVDLDAVPGVELPDDPDDDEPRHRDVSGPGG